MTTVSTKNLERMLLTSAKQQDTPEVVRLIKSYKDRPFWCGTLIDPNPAKQCWSHSIGLPVRNGQVCPIWDYQDSLVKTYLSHNFVYVKKARALGISFITLSFLAYLGICKNYKYRNTSMLLVTGPREKTSIELVLRLKNMIRVISPLLVENTEKTICQFAGIRVIALPSDHLDDARGYEQISVCYSDESDFYSVGQQDLLRPILESFYQKHNKSGTFHCIFVSTPNLPSGLFYQMEFDQSPDFPYKRVFLPWTVGENKIYDSKQIELARSNPGWRSEFCLEYGFGTGTIFRNDQIDACICEYDTEPPLHELDNSVVTISCDPGGFGSTGSKFGIVSTCIREDNKIYILDCIEYDQINFDDSVQVVVDLLRHKYGYYHGKNNLRVFCDQAFPSYITGLKRALGDGDYVQQVEYCRQNHLELASIALISPIGFQGDNGRNMLFTLQSIVNSGDLRIHPKFESLALQMRIARTLPNGHLNKSVGNNSYDLLDAAMMCTSNIERRS